MFYVHDGVTRRHEAGPPPHVTDDWVWVDLLDPSDGERVDAEHLTGLRLPSRADVSEIENSSRVYSESGALYLSMPVCLREASRVEVTPIGFVLSNRWLITLRYSTLPSFESYAETFAKGGRKTSLDTFVGLLEVIVDKLADALEGMAADLTSVSAATFHGGGRDAARPRRRGGPKLEMLLTNIGAHGDALGSLRDTIVSTRRIVHYVAQMTGDWLSADAKDRLRILHGDIDSLNDYEQQLSTKISFLLDAVLGYINIEQNNVVKVLTVVSVIGIPPTFVVGLYGMNFKSMPEVDWPHGYAFGWAMIILSVIVPLAWLKLKRWL